MSLGTRANRLLLPPGIRPPGEINVVVEIPRGSRNKYEYDAQLDIFRLDRNLHSAIYYPGDYGFVPQTRARDGDPLDVLVLVENPSFTGCLLSVRPIGVLRLVDEGTPDDKIIAVPLGEPQFADVSDYRQASPHVIREIEHFFETYKTLEGKDAHSEGWQDAEAARGVVEEALAAFARLQPQV